MSEQSDQDDSAQAGDPKPATSKATEVRLRLWPAVFIVLVQLAALAYALFEAPTLILTVVSLAIVPMLSAVCLTIWWMTSRGVPFRQRAAGLLLIAATLGWVALTHLGAGFSLFMIVLPIIAYGTVLLLLVTAGQPWPRRRNMVAALMIGCAIFFTAVRVDGAKGNLSPVMAWRWTATPEERFEAFLSEDRETSGVANLPAELSPGDWPGFRGSMREGHVDGVTFATDWDTNAPKELWRRPIGIGWSSFTVIGDYFFTQEQRGEEELTVCYNASTGEQVWVNSVTARFDEANGGGPRATPTFHEGRLYVLGAMGAMQCLDASTGKVLWKRDLTGDAQVELPQWAFASSPLIAGNLVVVFAGGPEGRSVVAYDRDSGEPVWLAGDGTHGYVSGYLTTIADVPQILFSSDIGIQSFVPESGEILWRHDWVAATNPRCVQPLVLDSGAVLIGTAGGQGTRRIQVLKDETGWKVEEEWTTREFRPYFNDAVHHEGFSYGFDGRLFACIDVVTGERKWKASRYGGQVLLIEDMGLILILSEKGEVILAEATPEAYNEVARFKALDGKTWNHPVIAHGKLFLRNSYEAVCYALPNESS